MRTLSTAARRHAACSHGKRKIMRIARRPPSSSAVTRCQAGPTSLRKLLRFALHHIRRSRIDPARRQASWSCLPGCYLPARAIGACCPGGDHAGQPELTVSFDDRDNSQSLTGDDRIELGFSECREAADELVNGTILFTIGNVTAATELRQEFTGSLRAGLDHRVRREPDDSGLLDGEHRRFVQRLDDQRPDRADDAATRDAAAKRHLSVRRPDSCRRRRVVGTAHHRARQLRSCGSNSMPAAMVRTRSPPICRGARWRLNRRRPLQSRPGTAGSIS